MPRLHASLGTFPCQCSLFLLRSQPRPDMFLASLLCQCSTHLITYVSLQFSEHQRYSQDPQPGKYTCPWHSMLKCEVLISSFSFFWWSNIICFFNLLLVLSTHWSRQTMADQHLLAEGCPLYLGGTWSMWYNNIPHWQKQSVASLFLL